MHLAAKFQIMSSNVTHNKQVLAIEGYCSAASCQAKRLELKQCYVHQRNRCNPAITAWNQASKLEEAHSKSTISPQWLHITNRTEVVCYHINKHLHPFRCDCEPHQLRWMWHQILFYIHICGLCKDILQTHWRHSMKCCAQSWKGTMDYHEMSDFC